MEEYFAHIAPDGRKQTVRAHLEGTARLCAAYAADFQGGEQGELAGLAHDLGKYSAGFQRRLSGGPRVDHATAGAFACMKMGQPFAAFAAAGHHGGLPDGGSQTDGPDSGSFFGRMNRAAQGRLPDSSAWQSELALPSSPLPEMGDVMTEGMFFTRMLFSSLVDADRTDTAEFMSGTPQEAERPSVEQLWDRFQAHISRWFPPQGALNAQRCAILERCIQEGERRGPGLFTLTVPTGGGKTAASLAFALAQARAHKLRRVVYVIPYTSIIEQTAREFRKILGADSVLEHHSNVQYDPEEALDAGLLLRATETWDMPVVVTTAVQFFESLFSNRPSQCRKLHNLARSAVVFDEAQMLPLPCLRPCVWAIAQLVRRCQVSAVLCTATQPALTPLFRTFAPELAVTELCPPPVFSWDAFRRVTFRRAGTLDWEGLAAQLQARRQVLCVVNARKTAQEIFSRLTGEGNFHLSTLMYPAHRQAQLEEIRRRLAEGRPCRVISTSLIEAGVDVDFPAVFREEAGLDSILQAAGRCNREGKRPAADSPVTIFRGESAPPPLFAAAAGAGRSAMDRFQDPSAPEAVRAYFTQLLDLKGDQALDKEGILPLMKAELFPFRTVSERFHMLDSPTATVYIPLGEGAELVKDLRDGRYSLPLYRRLGRYGVSVYRRHLESLERAGDLERLEDGSFVLRNLSLYSPGAGLSLEAEGGQAQFI